MYGWKYLLVLASIAGLGRAASTVAAEDTVSPADQASISVEGQVRSLLANRCYKCHGPATTKGNLSLSSGTAILAGGDSGPAIVPGKPGESLLIEAVRYANDQLRMPPDGKLSPSDIELLTRWVSEGAKWSTADQPLEPTARPDRSGNEPILPGRDLWSLRPVARPSVPAVGNQAWPAGDVDRFILARLEEHGLRPAEPADKRTLLRRATFDLIGLPPTPEEMDDFLRDESPDAFAKVVDRLLASPHYGQRWGRHWLDVVRYADARDLIQLPPESDFREAWRYRDWVVGSLNADMPYAEFIRKQIAGDLLQPGDTEQIDADSLIATGMLAIADFVPGDVDKDRMIADYVNDQIDVVGRGVLGLTLACARCHDHKFDPISTKDYYALAGIFFSSRLIPGPVKGNTPLTRATLLPPGQLRAIEQEAARDKQRAAELATLIQGFPERGYLEYLQNELRVQTEKYLLAAGEYRALAATARPSITAFAAARGLDEKSLSRWWKYIDANPHPTLAAHLASVDDASRVKSAQEIAVALSDVVDRRAALHANDPLLKGLADAAILSFRADDPRLSVDQSGRLCQWPDRAGLADDAVRVAGTAGPTVTTTIDQGRKVSVVRFSGQELLETKRSVPDQGTLLVVFRPDAQSASGQRLIGWEDSAVGQHGVGLICDGNGALQAVVRRNGASGDLTAPAVVSSELQMIAVTWGSSGVTLHRNGELVSSNPVVEAVSSDPEIMAMRIGGPGSGAAARFTGDLAELQVYGEPLSEAARKHVEAELRERWLSNRAAPALAIAPFDDLYGELLSPRGPLWLSEEERDQALPAEARSGLTALRGELAALKSKQPVEIPRAVVVQEGGPPETKHAGFHDAAVSIRGNPANPGPIVPRGFPRAIAGDEQPVIRKGSGRRELADWLASPRNPLTARVAVNRIWQHHFGVGLVRTSANFGTRGETPSHPELLDFLAERFVASGWSFKAMHRMLMTTATYRQQSRASTEALSVDPENRLLSRMNRRRLESEAIRDGLLAVAGRLDVQAGGPAFTDVTAPRRSLYLMSVRTGAKAADFSPLFDAANCSAIVEQRAQSTVAPQALFFMNDPFVLDLATALASRVAAGPAGENADRRIAESYAIALGRPPTAAELQIARGLLADDADGHAFAAFCHVLLCTNEFIYVD